MCDRWESPVDECVVPEDMSSRAAWGCFLRPSQFETAATRNGMFWTCRSVKLGYASRIRHATFLMSLGLVMPSVPCFFSVRHYSSTTCSLYTWWHGLGL